MHRRSSGVVSRLVLVPTCTGFGPAHSIHILAKEAVDSLLYLRLRLLGLDMRFEFVPSRERLFQSESAEG